jgi:hypothetical protein
VASADFRMKQPEQDPVAPGSISKVGGNRWQLGINLEACGRQERPQGREMGERHANQDHDHDHSRCEGGESGTRRQYIWAGAGQDRRRFGRVSCSLKPI